MLGNSTVVCHREEINTSISGMDGMLVTLGYIVLLARVFFFFLPKKYDVFFFFFEVNLMLYHVVI